MSKRGAAFGKAIPCVCKRDDIKRQRAERLPLLVTTNHNPLIPGGNVDERIVSRLTEGARTGAGWSRIVPLPCGDFRTQRRAA